MRSYPVFFLFIPDQSVRAASAQTSLRNYAGSSERSHLALAISAHFLRAGSYVFSVIVLMLFVQVRKTAMIRNNYNQVPHLSQDTKWKSIKITINITNKSQEVGLFPSDDHKAAMNKRESMANTRHK